MFRLIAIVFALSSISCGDGMLNEYLNGDSAIWTNAPVYVDSTGYAEMTIVTDFGYPQIVIYYGCDEADLQKLKKLDADLIIDGKTIEASESTCFATYANSTFACPLDQAFDSLPEQLGIDSSSYMESFSVSIQLVMKYQDMEELPKQLSVHFTSESAGGNTDTTIVLTLRSTEDTRMPIRIH